MVRNSDMIASDNQPIKVQRLPQDVRAMQGVWLFLLTLGIFFLSSILLFILYVALRLTPEVGLRPQSFYLPRSFLSSTLLLFGVSGALEWALRAAKGNRSNDVKVTTVAGLIMGLLFMAVQSEGMYRLVVSASEVRSSRNSVYALTFVLAFLHAMHVVGGIIGLVSTTFNANRDKYDRERHFGLRFCTLYWHFLDIVWILLLACFVITGMLVNSSITG